MSGCLVRVPLNLGQFLFDPHKRPIHYYSLMRDGQKYVLPCLHFHCYRSSLLILVPGWAPLVGQNKNAYCLIGFRVLVLVRSNILDHPLRLRKREIAKSPVESVWVKKIMRNIAYNKLLHSKYKDSYYVNQSPAIYRYGGRFINFHFVQSLYFITCTTDQERLLMSKQL